MNVRLQTKTEDPSLEFVNLARFEDGSGYCTDLVVVAHGFSARLYFCFETHPMDVFMEQLRAMNATLRGKAVLKPLFEDPYIVLEMQNLGHVHVSGELMRYGELTQRLEFEFMTDQTVLQPLIEDLLVVRSESVAV